MMLAPFDDLPKDGLVDLNSAVSEMRHGGSNLIVGQNGVGHTLGIGIASSTSPTSSSMFLISTERSATSLSVWHSRVSFIKTTSGRCGVVVMHIRGSRKHTDGEGCAIGAHELNLGDHLGVIVEGRLLDVVSRRRGSVFFFGMWGRGV